MLKIFNLLKNLFFMFIVIISFFSTMFAQAQDERVKKLIEGAKNEKKMLWYTSMSVDHSTVMLEEFQKKYPFIKTELYRASTEKLLSKILAEAGAGKYNFDVVAESGFEAHILKKEGLLMKYISPESAVYPKGFKDPDGYWVDLYDNTYVIAYNTKLIKPEDVPKTYEDLLQPKYKDKLAMDNEEYEWFANMLLIMGRKKGLEYMKNLSTQNIQFHKGHTLMAQMLAAGELSIVIGAYGHRIEEFIKKGAPVNWTPVEPIVVALHPVGINAKAPNPDSAKLFIDFLLSKEGQSIIRKLGRIPARPDVEPDPPRLTKGLKLWPSEPALAENFKDYIKMFKDIFLKKK